MQVVHAVVKMLRLVGEDKEYGVIKNWGRIPKLRVRPGQDTFFLRCFELAFLLSDLSFLIVLGTWIKQILLNF